MLRTRDVYIILALLICAATGAGFVVTGKNEETKGTVREHTTPEAIFLTPREAYDVAPYVDDSFSDSRESFIEKVRSTYPKKEAQVVPEVTISAPTTPVPPVIQATTTYGDTGF